MHSAKLSPPTAHITFTSIANGRPCGPLVMWRAIAHGARGRPKRESSTAPKIATMERGRAAYSHDTGVVGVRYGRGCCAVTGYITPWTRAATRARRNLDAIDSHLGRWLQDARHYEPPVLDLFDAPSCGWCLLVELLLASCRCHRPVDANRQRLGHIPYLGGNISSTARRCLLNNAV